MNTFSRTAVASLLLLGLGTVANAQTVRPGDWVANYDQAPLLTGRSTYVNRAPRSDAEADQIVMGLRVPYGPR